MATTEAIRKVSDAPDRILLHNVPRQLYDALRDADGNEHVRITYHNGTMELMSPLKYAHEKHNRRLAMLVRAVAKAFGIPSEDVGSTTLRIPGAGAMEGSGREADTSFYLGENARRISRQDEIDLTVDPPPDLAIEVDDTAKSQWKLAVYADLGVPEVWRLDLRSDTLWFGRLQADKSYAALAKSEVLPMLTPAWVLDAISRGKILAGSEWESELKGWIRDELVPR